MSGWQSAPLSKRSKRAFIGNLNNHPNIEEKLRELFSRSAITPLAIEIVPLKQPNTKCYALIQCDVGMAIKCLNGMRFDGNILNVKPEKKDSNGRKKKGMGFGGGWSAPKASKNSDVSATQRNTFIGQNTDSEDQKHKESKMTSHAKQSPDTILSASMDNMKLESGEVSLTNKSSDVANFHRKCKTPLKDLMAGYGAYDPDYEKMKARNVGDEFVATQSPNTEQDARQKPEAHSGMLAPNGKAPIHIELVSFGYKYSVPSQARDGWSHSNPLSPIDCRDLPRCPHFVSKLSGLSFKVKRAMLSATIEKKHSDSDESGDEDNGNMNAVGVNPLLVKSEKVSITILKAIEEAINDGGHGYAFPLETKIYLGSEYGRHRSVVLCENMAQKIRSLLRKNVDGRIDQPVSVSTRHRDVDQKHRDEEAFGKDLRREHDAEVKRKKREDWLESKW